jgi:hypothetical protein
MLNSTTWLYGAEVLPIALRSKVMGLAAASHFIVNVGSKSLYGITFLIVGVRFKLTCASFAAVTEAGPSGKSLTVTDLGISGCLRTI